MFKGVFHPDAALPQREDEDPNPHSRDTRLPFVMERQWQSSTRSETQTLLISCPKFFGFFGLVFRVMELKVFLLCSEKGRNNNLCN